MNRRVLAAMLGLAVAGCAQTRSDLPLATRGVSPVGMVTLPSLHETINTGAPVAPASFVVPRDPRGPWAGPVPAGPRPRLAPPRTPAPRAAADPSPGEPAPPGDLPPLPAEPPAAAAPDAPPVDAGTRPASASAAVAPPPPGMTFSETVARVGDDVITFNELRTAVEERLRDLPPGQPPSREELNRAGAMMLDRLIDRTLVIQQARRELKNPKAWDLFTAQADEAWKKEELPVMLKQTGSADEAELKRKLAERGMALDDMRAAYHLDTIAREYLRMKLLPKLKVDLPDLREYYRTHQAEFDRPAQVTWREVAVSFDNHPDRAAARAKAEALLARLSRGEPFAAVAKAGSEGATAAQGGLWETSPGSYAVPAVNHALETLPLNQTSAILEGEAGLHIVRVEARRRAGPAPFEEVQFEIRNNLTNRTFSAEMTAYLEKLRARTSIRTVFDGTQSDPNAFRSAQGAAAAAPATAAITPRELPQLPPEPPAAAADAAPELPDLPDLGPEAPPAPAPAEPAVQLPDLPL